MNNNELYHYGKLGMRWGIRRSKKPGMESNVLKRTKKFDTYHEDYKNAHSRKSVKKMSNDELQSRNNRLQMENKYSKNKIDQNKIMKGATYLAAAVTVTGAAVTLYNNSSRIVDIGQSYIGSALKKTILPGL